VIHVRHDSTEAGSPYRPGQPGNDFLPGLEPAAGEWGVPKRTNSAFIRTDLEPRLRSAGIGKLVVAG
jgi:nicotinamidase-related amidase